MNMCLLLQGGTQFVYPGFGQEVYETRGESFISHKLVLLQHQVAD